jgi:hypothetical protein
LIISSTLPVRRPPPAAKNKFWSSLSCVAFVGVAFASYGQSVDTVVEVPTTAHRSALIEIPTAQNPTGDTDNITMAGEYKSTKNVVEEQKPVCWNWAADIAYESEYNFRGTNLTPDADGAGFIQAEVSRWGFTLGVFGLHQFGTARSPSFSIGEGGGGGTTALGSTAFLGVPISALFEPETTQDRFNELDVFFQYQRSFGWFDVAVGNIGFFIDRKATTFVTISDIAIGPPFFVFIPGPFTLGPFRSVEDERFDRLYVALSTSKIPHIQPVVTYYQTVLNTGEQPGTFDLANTPIGPLYTFFTGKTTNYHGGERNDELGGYIEGRLKGNFAITEWLSVNPQGVISASFHDRSVPVTNPMHEKDAIRGRSLSGWNVAQVGIDLPIRLLHTVGFSSGPCAPADLNVYITPFGWYSYHISDPTPSTDRNEFWGGVKLTATF